MLSECCERNKSVVYVCVYVCVCVCVLINITDITASNYINALTLKKEAVRSFETLKQTKFFTQYKTENMALI